MKFITQLIAIALISFALELTMPWWSIAIAAFGCGYLFRSRQNFLAGFLGIALLWSVKALLLNQASESILTEGVAKIFSLNKPLLFLVTAVIGGLVGGFAATAGSALKQ